ncbi:DUF1593 domain-containing protein [Parapedobacter indicus]|uniref:DUF1593 domain-containing protein n=1 Tax=Parapedobacter indicus TaxID=1477437 RepID=A0A1I3FBQ3_9SPHI|nr:DUF1593 domain-containing protein [Parapedobacter indicus]PPL03645.1 uncharacterized protein DUF1593 [Parapedobacter indicus]SFI08619.1 Protein of unknown function [Parapedobacter indicus]
MRGWFLWVFALGVCVSHAQERPSVLVLTDIGGDPDDQQSLVRLLLYSDVLNITGIVATSTMGHGLKTHPNIVQEAISRYEQVYPALQFYAPSYPEPGFLHSIVKSGLPDYQSVGRGWESEGANHINEIVRHANTPVYVVVWGGHRELAQALWEARESSSADEFRLFCSKIRVYGIGDQDGHRDSILRAYPDLLYVASGYYFPGKSGEPMTSVFRGMYQTGQTDCPDRDWVRTHVHGHGALADFYPLDGHGTAGMKEGDTPSFLALIPNGLNVADRPEWGGWGGRFRKLRNQLFIDAPDFLDGTLNERHTVSRWRSAFQSDFMARLDRCIRPTGGANRAPVAVLNGESGVGPIKKKAKPGEVIELVATGSFDPDGDSLTFQWFNYWEAGTCPGSIPVEHHTDNKALFKVPEDAEVGTEFHLILEVHDRGLPSLVSYRRLLLEVTQ